MSSAAPGPEPEVWLDELAALWRAEQAAARAKFAEARRGTTLAQRVQRGLALADLTVVDVSPAPGDRLRVWLEGVIDELRIAPGDPVRLWHLAPEEEDAVRGVLVRRDTNRVQVMVEGDLPFQAMFHLDAEAPEISFERGAAAIHRARGARGGSDLLRMRDVLCLARTPHRAPPSTWEPIDTALDEVQRAAVAAALDASDVALIHGPPGTGKTRTLVEVVRQLVARGERVLAAAASNAAVDHLGEQLIAAGVPVVRIGHPARVAPAVEDHTLDALVSGDDGASLARRWMDEARSLRLRADARAGRGAPRDELRELWSQARSLDRDARAELERVERTVLDRARVVLATCAGAAHPALADEAFDSVVLDEATKAPDPLALVALSRGRRAVLAGDPRQLPPTVIDIDAARAGLSTTFFERLAARGEAPHTMLVVQHRMHADIMRFPSASMYEGKLVAAPEVAAHTLADLGARPDPLRPGAVYFVDTAGADLTEQRAQETDGPLDPRMSGRFSSVVDPSTRNPGHAARVAAEVRRVLSRGVAPTDIAVIAAYDAQVRLLRELLAVERDAGVEIGTVDGFQGREKEVIVVDLVRSNELGEIGFLADTRRMNVALTRARRFLVVIGDSATLGGHPYYAAFAEAMDAIGAHGSIWADDAGPI